MSKKMRKKSSKTASRIVVHEAPAARAKPSQKAGGSRPSVASKKPKTHITKTPPEPSHKGAQKPLKAVPSQISPTKARASRADIQAPSLSTGVAEGSRAPAFELPRDGGARVSLADFAGRKLVIFFYPRANTPGCTKEAIDFTRLSHDFAACGTDVVGVSADPVKAQESFRTKHRLSIPLLSDERHNMLEAYGVWGEKPMYGKVFQGVLRTTVLVDEGGRIAHIWRRVRVDGHAEAVLAAARNL